MLQVWIAASIVWAATVDIVMIPNTLPKQVHVATAPDTSGDVPQENLPKDGTNVPESDLGLTWEQYQRQQQIEATWHAIGWTVVPPLGLIIAWFTGAWIVRGFRGEGSNA
jgi:hypothetical protein